MGSDKIWEKLMELSIISGMNQRYAQHLLTEAEWHGKLIDQSVVILTVLTLCLAVAAMFKPDGTFAVPFLNTKLRFDVMATVGAILAALAGVMLIVSPSNKEVHHYGNMLQAWTDLRTDIDSVIVDADAEHQASGNDQAYLERRYRELLAKKNMLNAREPAPDHDLIERFLTLEEQSRGSYESEKKGSGSPKAARLASPRASR